MVKRNIRYPYLPENRIVRYVSEANFYMLLAKQYARFKSRDRTMPVGAVLVKNRRLIGCGANGSDYHTTHQCRRRILGCKTGQGYELCEGCHPKNHAESKTIKDAKSRRENTQGARLYLWGHWWCCEPCWNAMIAAGIEEVYLLEYSETLFNAEHPDNIIGRQFKEGE